MERQLYLLRHARAEPWNPLGNDFSRPLSDKGKHHANALSLWTTGNLAPPDTVMCSPSKRARETLAPLLAKWPQLLATTEYVDSIYGASLDMLLTLVNDALSYSQRLLLVGHNPGFEDLLSNVSRVGDAAGRPQMPTGALAVIEFPGEFKGASANGQLRELIRHRDLLV